MFEETETIQHFQDGGFPPIQASCLAGFFRKGFGAVQQAVVSELDQRGYLTEAAFASKLDQRGYLTEEGFASKLDQRGYLTEEGFASKLVIELDRRQYATKSELKELRSSTEAGFKALDDKVGRLDGRVGRLETKVGQLDVKVGQLDTRVGELRSDIKALDGKVDRLDDKLDAKVGQLDAKIDALPGKLGKVAMGVIAFLGLVVAALTFLLR